MVVVGSGSAGGVLAARLSEDPRRSVLLLEAGPDTLEFQGPKTLWNFMSANGFLPRGKILGGCSATNAAIALDGYPEDYDSWPEGWSWSQVRPALDRVHEQVPVRTTAEVALTELSRAFMHTAMSLGHKHIDDHNEPGAAGVGPAPMNAIDGVHQSTALTYLARARGRANLTIRCDTIVERIAVENGRAVGVVVAGGETIPAERVIVSAGAYSSPVLLLRSGIGPAGELSEQGIDVVLDLPGVGRNLQDHALVPITLRAIDGTMTPRFEVLAAMRSASARYPSNDLQFFVGGPPAGPAVPGSRDFILCAALMKPQSRGSLRLADPPHIDLGLLSDPADLPKLREAVDELLRVASAEPFASLVETRPPDVDDAWIRANVTTYHHPTGTCAMGSVVDSRGKVLGIEGLWVVDASIMPEVPAANTNFPTMMLAERAMSWLQEAL